MQIYFFLLLVISWTVHSRRERLKYVVEEFNKEMECESDADCKRRSCEFGNCTLDGCVYEVIPDLSEKVLVKFKTDQYPSETSWKIFGSEYPFTIAHGEQYSTNETLHKEIVSVCASGEYKFCFYDSFGDGNCCDYGEGYYELYVGNDMVASNDIFVGKEECKVFNVDFCNTNADCNRGNRCEVGECKSQKCIYDLNVTSEVLADVEILTDSWPADTYWSFFDLEGSSTSKEVATGGKYDTSHALFSETVSLCKGLHQFCIYDSFGDGNCCDYGFGHYSVSVANNIVASGGKFTNEECTDFNAGGCKSNDNCQRRSCEVGKCNSGMCEFNVVDSKQKEVHITIKTDDDPSETSWKIYDLNYSHNMHIESGEGYDKAETLYTTKIPLCYGKHNFCIFDTYGDGNCCNWGKGYYMVKVGAKVVAKGGQFEMNECTVFEVEQTSPTPFPTKTAPTKKVVTKPTTNVKPPTKKTKSKPVKNTKKLKGNNKQTPPTNESTKKPKGNAKKSRRI